MKKLFQTLKIAVLALVLAAGINWASATYISRPTVAPTGGNTPAPLNTGSAAQSRIGSLALGTANAPAATLDVYGSIIANSIASFANTVVTGNVTAGSLTLSGMSGTGNQSLCVNGSGGVVVCGSSGSLPSLKTATITNSGCSGDCSFVTGSGSSYSFNAASVYLFKVDVYGAGGGGGLSGSNGGSSSVSGPGVSITAGGGFGATSSSGASGGTASGGDFNLSGVSGLAGSGPNGVQSSFTYWKYTLGGAGGRSGNSSQGNNGGNGGNGEPPQQTGGGGPGAFLDNVKSFFIKTAYAVYSQNCAMGNQINYAAGAAGTGYGGGGGGAGANACNVGPVTASIPVAGGGGGGAFASKTVVLSSPGSSSYSITTGSGGGSGSHGGSGSKGAVIITYQQ